MKKNNLLILFVFFGLTLPIGPLYAPGFSLSENGVGPFLTDDNITINLGNDFSSGEVISSSQINQKFELIQKLLNELMRGNPSFKGYYDSLVNQSTNKKIVFMTSQTFNGNLGGRTGANEKCNNDYNANTVRNASSCTNIFALISTDDLPFINLDSGTSNYYDPSGNIIAGSWDEFLNLNSINLTNFGGYSGMYEKVWTGKDSGKCSNWETDSQSYNAAVINTSEGNFNNLWGSSISQCSSWNSLLCLCE